MNVVESKSHRWKIVLSAAVAVTSGLLIVSVAFDLPNVPISTAFGGAAPSQPLQQPDCRSLAPDGEAWHGVEVDLGDEPVSVHVGSARVDVERARRPGFELNKLRWHSDLGIDAVVVQAATQSRVHRFEQERFDGLHHPFGDRDVDKITLCYDLELTVNTDANPSFTRTYQWSIEESVEPAHWQLQPGGSGVSTYRVSVTKDQGTEQGWRVSGTITIDNLTPSDVELAGVDTIIEGSVTTRVECGVDLDGYVLESGASLVCDYDTELPDASQRTATARVRTRGRVDGASATSPIDFRRAEVREVGQSVYVSDNQGRTWTFHETGSTAYKRSFRCDTDAGLHPSAVRIGGTDQRSSTSVSVDCQPDKGHPTAARP